MCAKLDEDPVSCLRLFAKCKELDPALVRCGDEYAEAARNYTQARCTKPKPGVGLHLGTREPRTDTRLLKATSETLYVDTQATFSSADVASVEDHVPDSRAKR